MVHTLLLSLDNSCFHEVVFYICALKINCDKLLIKNGPTEI